MVKEITWSHSKLKKILTCPMSYNIIYNHKIFPKFEKEALGLGSAVHWGIENNTENLEKYYEENSKFKNKFKAKDEQILAEAMVSGYLKHKDELLAEILYEKETGEILDLLEEHHELKIYGKLKSNIVENNKFVGIIDYLLLTNLGFIVIDFKTSSSVPEWENYLDQLYRYIYLLKEEHPDIPVHKIAIINLRKCKVKRKTGENDKSFRKRLDVIYQLNDEKHIDVHIYKSSEINVKDMNVYIENLGKMCDAALSIINSGSYYINYSAVEDYGGSELKELLLNNEGAYTLYNVKDECYNEITNQIEDFRDMYSIDLEKIFYNIKTCNRYSDFKLDVIEFEKEYEVTYNQFNKDEFFDLILSFLEIKYDKVEAALINKYVQTYYYEFPPF